MKKGWEIRTLGECCEIVNGGTPKSKVADYWGGKHRWITPAEMGGLATPFLNESRRTLTDKGLESCSAKILPANSVILSSRAPIGHLVINAVPMATNQGCKGLVPGDGLEAVFLYYCLMGMVPQLEALGTGATFKELSSGKLKQVVIPVPPLPEQRRIVAILDEAFEGIAAAKANAERSELAAADLFRSQSWAVFDRLGKSHEWRTLSQLIDSGWVQGHLDGNHGSDYPRKEEFVASGVPYISANCLDADAVVMSRCKFLSPQRAANLRKGIARSRDVLFAHNATVGPVAILETSEPKVILGTSLTYYRCDESKIIPEYLALFMRSAGFVTQYEQVMRQSTRNQVPITKQREFRHVIPTLSEQRQVIATLGELSGSVRKSRSNYNQKLTALDELKASLLHQAFTGNL